MEAAKADPPTKTARKRTRKRPYTRKASLTTAFINMAQARKEIVNALHLHRSSTLRNPTVPCSLASDSTTASAVPTVEAVLEVEWFDNVSASYTWWMGFLSSLDRKNESAAEGSGGLVTGSDAEKTGSGRDEQGPFIDEWVVFPPGEECGGELNNSCCNH